MVLALVFLVLAIGCYSISQLAQHGKLKWTNLGKPYSFWGERSWRRKYKDNDFGKGPAFFLSTTWLVFLTDGYHFAQSWSFNFLALSYTFALGFNWWLLCGLLFGIRIVHSLVYKLLSK